MAKSSAVPGYLVIKRKFSAIFSAIFLWARRHSDWLINNEIDEGQDKAIQSTYE